MVTPGFLETGINFIPLIKQYLANNCYVEITDPVEVSLVRKLMRHIIDSSYGYNEESSDFAQTEHGRFQMIFNSTLQELIAELAGLVKKSKAVWLLTDSYEKGTDFQSTNGKQIEAKVYKNYDSMINYAKKGSVEYTVFHGAEYVLCYLVDSHEGKHWYWLKKVGSVYSIYSNEELDKLTSECLPKAIPICYCKLRDNKFVIGKSTFCN